MGGEAPSVDRVAERSACVAVPCGQCGTSGDGNAAARCAWADDRRPRALGKFFFVGGEKLYLRGVTYGAFRPGDDGTEYPPDDVVERDFAAMAANGIDTVRTYTVPPRRLLEAAHRHGLRVLIGIAWEQHVAFLSGRRRAASIEQRVRESVRACAGHPAVLGYAVGNEIPASIVRWHGRRRVERFIERLYRAAKDEDPEALVTYVNYPSTEYLELPFLDFVAFNVYLERESDLEAYIARLQNIAGERPLVLSELGLDSRRHGENGQARALAGGLGVAFSGGCAGALVFAWTDEWHRGGHDIDDWDFGITDRERRAKPALARVREAFADVPVAGRREWPRVSVVVCTRNGARTLAGCLAGVRALDYPEYELIVVDDGSTDASAAIAAAHGAVVISTENGGLSAARNVGLEAASGEIVAYLDDDARPDPQWLRYLAATFMSTSHAGVGGPNLPPPGDGAVAEGVANAPGGPAHVLVSDLEAEHIPGCNMAFRRSVLEELGGFDPQFRIAGDDVDLCWRVRDRGWTLGFNPAAVVWHHRRGSVRAFYRQQREYGKAEALLERKWPARYNRAGHLAWGGRLYGGSSTRSARRRDVFYGRWGSALFQSLYHRPQRLASSLPLMPEWYLAIAALAGYAALSRVWQPFVVAVPLLAFALALPLVEAVRGAARVRFAGRPRARSVRIRVRALTALLYLLQPLARLVGRLRYGLTPWRRRWSSAVAVPRPRAREIWRERGESPERTLGALEDAIAAESMVVHRNGPFDRWDLHVRAGPLGASRLLCGLEEHGSGKQLARVRWWPQWSKGGLAFVLLFAGLAIGALASGAWPIAVVCGNLAAWLAFRAVAEAAAAVGSVGAALDRVEAGDGARAPAAVVVQAEEPSVRRRPKPHLPAFPPRRWSPERVVRLPRPRLALRRSRPKEPAPWRLWGPQLLRVLPYLKPYWKLAFVAVLLIGLTTLTSLLAPWPLAILVDSVLGDKPLPSLLGPLGMLGHTELLVFAVVAGLLLTAVENVVTVVNEYVTTKLDQRMVLDFRSDLFRHSQGLSLAFHDNRRTGDFMYCINLCATSAGSLVVAIPPLAQSVVTLIGMVFVTYQIDHTMALLALSVVPFVYYSIGYYTKKIEPRLNHVRRLEGESLAIVHEAMAMLRVIVAFGREPHEFSRFRDQARSAVDARVNVTVRQTVFSLVVNTITAIGTALVLGYGARQAMRGQMTVGELLVVMGYIAAVYQPLEQISGTIASLQQHFVSLRAALELLDAQPEITDAPDAVALASARGEVAFEGVSFSYRGREDTLVDVEFTAQAGDRVAIVGPTGAGKTTLVSLIPRFYDPSAGRVLLDGADLRTVTRASLRAQISIVLQEPLLFSGTIEDNIRYGRLDATVDEIVEAARAANAHDFISRLPDGYATRLGEGGAKLSGGERQRVSVARAFLKDAPVLILDEPTSSIDSKTEAVILDALDRLMEGRTTFLIAHRLSTIRDADLILVLNDGRVVEQGRHDDLLRRGGLYAQLYAAQTRLPAAAGGNGRALRLAAPPEEAAAAATRSLVQAVRLLLAAGGADLRVLAEREAEPEEIRAAAAALADLTPEQLHALRDLEESRLASIVASAGRVEEPVEANAG